MSGPLRNKQGCWTCRLRKKKCDEDHPHCSTCRSLSITCYGYGPRPDWMNGGEEEKAVVKTLKQIVKHTSRRKAAPQVSGPGAPPVMIAPKISNPSSDLGPSLPHVLNLAMDSASSQEDGTSGIENGSTNNSSPPEDNHGPTPASTLSLLGEESALVMHFLDYVFPLQYPLYNPGVLEGGRGWLLHILLQIKSVYHAALALSAYHRRATLSANISHPCQAAALVQQEKHLEICIKLVSQSAQASCPKKELGLATAVAQLMFFELFTGQSNAWQAHLRAAISIYHHGCVKNLSGFGLSEVSREILTRNLPLLETEGMVAAEVVAFRFLSCTIIWLDITFSITLGTVPRLLAYHSRILCPNPQTKLEDVMGCKNSVMLQIGRIAALYSLKAQALQDGDVGREFGKAINEIREEIQCSYALNEESDTAPWINNTQSNQITVVTRIFRNMASLYLHLVTLGFKSLDLLDPTISEAMELLQAQTTIHLLPALVLPLFVIGCVAGQEDKHFFRTIFSSSPLLKPSLKHRRSILPALEEIWKRRRTGIEWKDVLDLTQDMLLI